MSDPLVRMMMVTAGYWGVSFTLGMLSSPAWGFAVGSAGLLYLLSSQMRALEPADESSFTPSVDASPGGYHSSQPFSKNSNPTADALAGTSGEIPACGIGVLDHDYRLIWHDAALAAHLDIDKPRSRGGETLDRIACVPALTAYLKTGDFSRPLELIATSRHGESHSIRLLRYLNTQWLLVSQVSSRPVRPEALQKENLDNALHELRAPITVLLWGLDIVRERLSGDACSRDHLNAMLEQCHRMRKITEDLHGLSAMEAAPLEAADQAVGVSTLLRVVRMEAEALSAGRHRIVLEAQRGFDLVGSKVEIASAFSNLAANAVRYTPAGGEIRLMWRASAAGGTFAVKDTGIGVAPKHIARLTERFFQVDRAFSRKQGGSGLGLAIVKDALQRHQATLEIASEPGSGSCFTARFPAARLVPEAAEAKPASAGDDGDITRPVPVPPAGARHIAKVFQTS